MKESLNVGLDFGTSNSAIATVENDRVKIFKTKEGNPTQPSSIFIRVDGYISVGDQAIRDFQDPEQKIDEYHFIPSIKPGLPVEFYDGNVLRSKKTIIDGRFLNRYFPLEELGSSLISDLKSRAENTTGIEAENVVLGRPVYFSEDERLDKLAQNRLESAAKVAGFKRVEFVLEPLAAALYYEKYFSNGNPHKVFVFDFGGGTLDVSVLNIDNTGKGNLKMSRSQFPEAVLGTHGAEIGGNDIDKEIFESLFLEYFGSNATFDKKNLPMPAYLYTDITEWHLQEHVNKIRTFDMLREISNNAYCSDKEAVSRLITLVGDQQMYSVLGSIEAAKIQLSSSQVGQIKHDHKDIHIDKSLDRKKFAMIVDPIVESVKECIGECLKKSQVSPDEIDVILKVGGSSNNIFVDSLLQKIFPGKIKGTDVFTSVASGLAVAANDQSE